MNTHNLAVLTCAVLSFILKVSNVVVGHGRLDRKRSEFGNHLRSIYVSYFSEASGGSG